MRSRIPAASFPRVHRSAESSNTHERVHPILGLQRSIGNTAVLRLLRHGPASHADAAPVQPAQANAPCACGATCSLCSREEDADHGGLPAPLQDDFDPMLDVDTETPEVGMSPPDLDSPGERVSETGAARPLEAGWWTGDWYTGTNTIICDGSGSLTIHEATSYKYGVQDCTRQHEGSHRGDWYARYGNDICKGRKKGDLPHFDPKGKEAYADFLKSSECAAWKIGQTCRNEKAAACKDDDCKSYVKTFTTQADSEVKNYCG